MTVPPARPALERWDLPPQMRLALPKLVTSMAFNIDVVIVAFRSENAIGEAVRRTKSLGGDVVVVDHGDGRSANLAEALGAVTLLDPSNPGFGSGQNRGVAATSSPFVLLCNPDAAVEPAAVTHGAEFLVAHPDVAAVQGVIVNSCTGLPERSQGIEIGPLHLLGRALGARRLLDVPVVRRLASRSSHLRDHVERIPPGAAEVETLAATAILVRRTAFSEVGGFDPTYFLYGEDVDLCRRLRLRGWKLVAVPEIWATHANGGSSESAFERELSWWGGTMIFAARWWGSTPWVAAITAAALQASRLAIHCRLRRRELFKRLVLDPMRRRAARRTCGSQRFRTSKLGRG